MEAKKQPRHLAFAEEVARELVNNFNPIEQNQFLQRLRAITKELRTVQLEEALKKYEYLKESLGGLS
jgi:hypothetical protein